MLLLALSLATVLAKGDERRNEVAINREVAVCQRANEAEDSWAYIKRAWPNDPDFMQHVALCTMFNHGEIEGRRKFPVRR